MYRQMSRKLSYILVKQTYDRLVDTRHLRVNEKLRFTQAYKDLYYEFKSKNIIYRKYLINLNLVGVRARYF